MFFKVEVIKISHQEEFPEKALTRMLASIKNSKVNDSIFPEKLKVLKIEKVCSVPCFRLKLQIFIKMHSSDFLYDR